MSRCDEPLGSADVPWGNEELARRAQAGCTASYEELARRFQVPLVHFLERWGSREDAEDLAQDTLLRAFRNLHRYRPSWPFATWLFTIARRLRINQRRRRRPTAASDLLDEVEHNAPEPAELAAQKENRQRLWALAAGVLSEPQMTATWLHYVEEMPLAEIARVLGRSQVAAKVTLYRARKRLLRTMRRLDPEDYGGSRPHGQADARRPHTGVDP